MKAVGDRKLRRYIVLVDGVRIRMIWLVEAWDIVSARAPRWCRTVACALVVGLVVSIRSMREDACETSGARGSDVGDSSMVRRFEVQF